MICLMPAVLTFSLLCEDCYLELNKTDPDSRFIVSSVTNFLLVIKPLLNPLIYASRMQEIRVNFPTITYDFKLFCITDGYEENERLVSQGLLPIPERI